MTEGLEGLICGERCKERQYFAKRQLGVESRINIYKDCIWRTLSSPRARYIQGVTSLKLTSVVLPQGLIWLWERDWERMKSC